MKIKRTQLRRIIKEEIQRLDEIPKWRKDLAARQGTSHPGSSPPPPGHPSRSGTPSEGFSDDYHTEGIPVEIDHRLVDRLMDSIEEHGHKARFDGRYIIGIAPMTDRDGRPIQDIEKFDAALSQRTLIQKVRNWLGY